MPLREAPLCMLVDPGVPRPEGATELALGLARYRVRSALTARSPSPRTHRRAGCRRFRPSTSRVIRGRWKAIFRRLTKQKNRQDAIIAVASKLVTVTSVMLRHNEPYRDPRSDLTATELTQLRSKHCATPSKSAKPSLRGHAQAGLATGLSIRWSSRGHRAGTTLPQRAVDVDSAEADGLWCQLDRPASPINGIAAAVSPTLRRRPRFGAVQWDGPIEFFLDMPVLNSGVSRRSRPASKSAVIEPPSSGQIPRDSVNFLPC